MKEAKKNIPKIIYRRATNWTELKEIGFILCSPTEKVAKKFKKDLLYIEINILKHNYRYIINNKNIANIQCFIDHIKYNFSNFLGYQENDIQKISWNNCYGQRLIAEKNNNNEWRLIFEAPNTIYKYNNNKYDSIYWNLYIGITDKK